MSMSASVHNQVPIKKSDEQLQIVYGEVYAPGVPDVQNEFMSEEGVRDMAYKFMLAGRASQVDTNHDNQLNDSYVCESFIARKDDSDFIEGAWVVGVKCSDDIWEAIQSGDLNGFSMEALVVKEETELEMTIPESVTGGTGESNGHTHTFKADFTEEGVLIGGITNESEGHSHTIKFPTKTEEYDGHSHRFSFVEFFSNE